MLKVISKSFLIVTALLGIFSTHSAAVADTIEPPKIFYEFVPSGRYFGETVDYKINLSSPKGVEFGYAYIYMRSSKSVYNKQTPIISGLDPNHGCTVGSFDSGMVSVFCKPSYVFSEDTVMTLTFKNIIHQDYVPVVGSSYSEPAIPDIGINFVRAFINKQQGDLFDNIEAIPKGNTILNLVRRPIARAAPFSSDDDLTSDNYYFGEPANFVAQFKLPKGLKVGELGMNFYSDNTDLSSAKLTVVGLPPGTASVNYKKGSSNTHDFVYKLNQTSILDNDTMVKFIINGAVNPTLAESPAGYQNLGVRMVDVADNTNYPSLNSTAFFEYNNYNIPMVNMPQNFGVHNLISRPTAQPQISEKMSVQNSVSANISNMAFPVSVYMVPDPQVIQPNVVAKSFSEPISQPVSIPKDNISGISEIKLNPSEQKKQTEELNILKQETKPNKEEIKNDNLLVENTEKNRLSVDEVGVKMPTNEVVKKLGVVPKTIELKTENTKTVYNIVIEERRKLFWFFPIVIHKVLIADAESGKLLSERLPWFSFLTIK